MARIEKWKQMNLGQMQKTSGPNFFVLIYKEFQQSSDKISKNLTEEVAILRRKEMLYMRIDAYNQIAQLYNVQNTQKAQKTSSVKPMGRDQVQISQVGSDYQIAKKAVSEASDIREDKVAQLKTMVESGEYKVEPGDFASKLLEKYNATLM